MLIQDCADEQFAGSNKFLREIEGLYIVSRTEIRVLSPTVNRVLLNVDDFGRVEY